MNRLLPRTLGIALALAAASETTGCRRPPPPEPAPAAEADGGSDAGSAPPPVFDAVSVNELLGHRKNLRKDDPTRFVLGSTGQRMWAISIDPQLGFSGEVNYIHEEGYGGSNLGTALYQVTASEGGIGLPVSGWDHLYWPDHLELTSRADATLTFVEEKLITADDCAVDVLQLKNAGTSARAVKLTAAGPLLVVRSRTGLVRDRLRQAGANEPGRARLLR